MKNVCNADNVVGKILGMRETDGLPVTMEHLDAIDNAGKAHYNDVVNQWGSEVLDEAQPHEGDDTALNTAKNWFVGDAGRMVRNVIQAQRNPSGLFGEARIKPVIDFVTQHHANFADDLGAGKQAYMDEIGMVFDDINTDDMGPTLKEAWNNYRRFYEEGGELYRMSDISPMAAPLSNLTYNLIKSSPNVVLGNIMEGAIKLPTLYPKTFMAGLSKAVEAGLFKELPEMASKGIYDINERGNHRGVWDGLIGLTDIPLKNIAYFAGELESPGGGARAVQRVAFLPRLGDLPSVYYSGSGRATVRLMSYTINSYKMYADLWKQAAQGNVAPLVTYHALAGVFGGGVAAGVPAALQGVITTAFPDTKEWFDQNQGALAKMIQPGNVDRVGVGFEVANRQITGAIKNFKKAAEYAQDGDFGNAALEGGDALLRGLSFTSSALGDVNIQKALRLGKAVAQEDLTMDELPQEAQDKFLPFLKQE